METYGSRAEMLSKMRLARMEKLKEKLAEEGIKDDTESPYPTLKKPAPWNEVSPAVKGFHSGEQRKVSRSPRVTSRSRSRKVSSRPAKEQNFFSVGTEEGTRQLGVEPTEFRPQTKFYDSAMEQYKRKVLIENLAAEGIRSKANCKKINKRSEHILKSKMEDGLMKATTEVCPEENSTLTFEKLGRILHLMEVFSIMKYDENCEVILDLELCDKAEQIQRYEEVKKAITSDDIS